MRSGDNRVSAVWPADSPKSVKKIRAILFSAPALILATAFMGVVSLICSLWDRDGRTQHRMAQIWARVLLAVCFVDLEVTGAEKLDRNRSYVVVANHASYMDIPVLYSAVDLQFRYFAKKGLFSIPILGWHLSRAGHLPVLYDDARASLKSLTAAAKLIRDRGVSPVLFPEGGRSEAGIQPFKEGAAYLAIKAGVPIVPVGMVNIRSVLPMHSLLLRPAAVKVNVGDPIETLGLTPHDRGRLNEMLQERVTELAGELPIHANA